MKLQPPFRVVDEGSIPDPSGLERLGRRLAFPIGWERSFDSRSAGSASTLTKVGAVGEWLARFLNLVIQASCARRKTGLIPFVQA
jgi:hypothetical protein